MTETKTKTREQELAEEFAAGMDPAGAEELAARVAGLEAEKAALEEQRDNLLADIAKTIEERDAAEKRAEAAEKKARAKVSRGAVPAKPRKLGPVENGLSGDALREAIDDARDAGKPVEIAFSDGKSEIAGVPPVRVEGDVWREHTLGLMLRDPVEVHGPADGAASVAIDGYALLIDGKQVAYCRRGDPINLAAGRTISVADDIYF